MHDSMFAASFFAAMTTVTGTDAASLIGYVRPPS
jgi:hypothetical protein